MKNFRLLVALLSPFMLSSCEFDEVNLGYPSEVTFDKEGGVSVVSSNENTPITSANIVDYETGEQGSVVEREDGTLCSTYEWLKVEYLQGGSEVTITAETNNTQSRTLHIEIYQGNEYQSIKVFQHADHLLE